MSNRLKITVIGGGSYNWSFGFIRQFADSENGGEFRLTLTDINEEALDTVLAAGMKYIREKKSGLVLEKDTNPESALDGAAFVLVTISTGGLSAMRKDLEIPETYGIPHTVGDTVGPGGWSRALRNIPVFYNIAEMMKKHCPDAWLLNMSNPLSVLTRVPHKYFGVKSVGMCPGVETMVRTLVGLAGLDPASPADFTVTGIDHGSWLTKLYSGGVNIMEKLKEKGYFRSDGKIPEVQFNDPLMGYCSSKAVFAVWRETGYIPAISDRHAVENWPWFLLDENKIREFSIKRTSIADRKKMLEDARKRHEDYIAGKEAAPGAGHGNDPVPAAVMALSGRGSLMWTSNYPNIGQIPGFPDGAVVETRCLFDGAGVHPLVSPMPDLLKSIVLPHALRQEMITDTALHGSFDDFAAIVTADPLCARVPFGKCREMARELVEANREYIKNPKLLEF